MEEERRGLRDQIDAKDAKILQLEKEVEKAVGAKDKALAKQFLLQDEKIEDQKKICDLCDANLELRKRLGEA